MFELGSRKLDVTPPIGCYLAGYAARPGPSTGVYHPLTASVVALSDGKSRVLTVSIEWLGFYERTPLVRQALEEATGVPKENVLLLGTHTHCGPAVRGLDARRHGADTLDEAYLTRTVERLCLSAREAMADRQLVQLWSGSGQCGFAASRLKPDGEGGVLWQPILDAPHDHEVPVLFAKNADGKAVFAFFSYACHPQDLTVSRSCSTQASEAMSRLPGCSSRMAPTTTRRCTQRFGSTDTKWRNG